MKIPQQHHPSKNFFNNLLLISSEATLLPTPLCSQKIMYKSDGLSILYKMFCSSKLLQTCHSIKQRKGATTYDVLHRTPRDLNVSPYKVHALLCMHMHTYTQSLPLTADFYTGPSRSGFGVWQTPFDLSKTLFSVGFQRLVWTDQKLHLSRVFFLFHQTCFGFIGISLLCNLPIEYILYTEVIWSSALHIRLYSWVWQRQLPVPIGIHTKNWTLTREQH